MPRSTAVTILLATQNGARWLPGQLASYLAQDRADWALWVSDDGSRDDTMAILRDFARTHGHAHDIRLIDGPQQGAGTNFLSLMCHPDLPRRPVALSDQDDVWMPHKLSRGLAALARADASAGVDAVTLYGAQSLHTDAALRVTGQSVPHTRAPDLALALVQNPVSGHSTMASVAALDLVRAAGVPEGVPFQDWWLTQLVLAAGGDLVIDAGPVLYYRQHDDNLLGAPGTLAAARARLALLRGGDYRRWRNANLAALRARADLLTPDARVLLDRLAQVDHAAGPVRAAAMWRAGLHRRTHAGSLAFYLAALMGWA